jgi:hypothetical protein
MRRCRKPPRAAQGRLLAAACALVALGCDDPGTGERGARHAPVSESAEASRDSGAEAGDGAANPGPSLEARELGCPAAERLVPATLSARSVLRAVGSTDLAADTQRSDLAGCRGQSSGPDRWYALDLSGFASAVELQAVVDAPFDALLELRRGACGDTESLDCDRARGVAATGSSIAARLEPDLYWLVVDGASPQSHGAFQLQVELDPAPGTCSDTGATGSCAAPLPLELLPRQTLLLDEACWPLAEDGELSSWYELDLSNESRPVRVHATAWTLSEPVFQHFNLYDANDTACASELGHSDLSRGLGRTNAELNALLAPGRYQLQLSFHLETARRAGLDLEIDRQTCMDGPVANHCEDAIVVDPSLPSQVLEGNTVCNSSRFQSSCAELDAPEQFYRLDLRSAPGPVRARVTPLVDGLSFPPIVALLTTDDDGVCPDTVYCDERIDNDEGPSRLDLILDPQLHYIVIDGAEPGAGGPYRLLIELEPAERSPCVDARIDDCVYANGQLDCCFDWSPACDTVMQLCGLARSTQDCLCTMAPACCGPERDASACRDAQQTCDYLCPEYAASEFSCIGPPP